MTIKSANPNTLRTILAGAQPGDTIVLEPGLYEGSYGTPTAGNPGRPITVAGGPEVVFAGAKDTPLAWTVNAPYWHLRDFHILPTAPAKSGQKPTWIAVRSAGVGAALACLTLGRDGDIEKSKAWNDYGVVIEADATIVRECRLYGMTKPIHVKGPAIGVTITRNHIGPSYQSSIVMGTSFGVNRACLIAYNILEESYIEDGVQFMQDLGAADPETDVSNLGAVLYRNIIRDCGENALDFKGAGFVVADQNEIYKIAGSNDGPLAGWNTRAAQAITRGARTASRHVIIRNHRIYDCAGGVRIPDQHWYIYHNEISNNNYSPADPDHAGHGIRQVGPSANTGVKNNLVYGNKGGDLILTGADASQNLQTPGPGGPLTSTRGAGSGRVIPLHAAGYFSAWYGRTDLPPEVIAVGEHVAHVVSVDHGKNTVTIDRDLTWKDGTPVCYGTGAPMVGPVGAVEPGPPVEPEPEPPIIVVPPPVEPDEPEPVVESVTLTGPPAAVAMLRALVGALGELSITD